MVLLAALLVHPAALAQQATSQDEDVKGRDNAQRLHKDLKSGKLRLGADLYEIIEKYGDPHKIDVGRDTSELRYRYAKGFDQGYFLIWLYFDKDKKLMQWLSS